MSGRIGTPHPDQLAAHARAWARRGLATDPVDWVAWEQAVVACYGFAGLRRPATVVRVGSPLALVRTLYAARVHEVPGRENEALAGLLRRLTQVRVDDLTGKVFPAHARAAVQRAVHDPVEAAVCGAAVARAVEETVHAGPLADDPQGVGDRVRSVASRLTGKSRAALSYRRIPAEWRSWTLHLGGQWEAAWSGYATFLAGQTGRAGRPGWRRRLDTLVAAQSAGWWWPHLEFVVVCERPQVVHTEPDGEVPGRLHRADGPAVVWPDGWRLYFWHGTRVPAWVVERPTIEAVHAEPNVEVRRCAIEALGWEAYVTGAGLRLVHQCDDPGNPGCRLSLYDLPLEVWGARARILLATNGSPERDGTRRRYGLPVPAGVGSALDAAAWTYGLTADQYARLARRT